MGGDVGGGEDVQELTWRTRGRGEERRGEVWRIGNTARQKTLELVMGSIDGIAVKANRIESNTVLPSDILCKQ